VRAMSEVSREVMKLKVRLKDVIQCEEEYIHALRVLIEKFQILTDELMTIKEKPEPSQLEKLSKRRFDAIRTFNEALEKGSKAWHEHTHLLESFGSLMITTEEAFLKLTP
jgi:hypothetical protein